MTYLKSHSERPSRISEGLFFFFVVSVAVLLALCIVGVGINIMHKLQHQAPTEYDGPKKSVNITQDQLTLNYGTDTPASGA